MKKDWRHYPLKTGIVKQGEDSLRGEKREEYLTENLGPSI